MSSSLTSASASILLKERVGLLTVRDACAIGFGFFQDLVPPYKQLGSYFWHRKIVPLTEPEDYVLIESWQTLDLSNLQLSRRRPPGTRTRGLPVTEPDDLSDLPTFTEVVESIRASQLSFTPQVINLLQGYPNGLHDESELQQVLQLLNALQAPDNSVSLVLRHNQLTATDKLAEVMRHPSLRLTDICSNPAASNVTWLSHLGYTKVIFVEKHVLRPARLAMVFPQDVAERIAQHEVYYKHDVTEQSRPPPYLCDRVAFAMNKPFLRSRGTPV